MTTEQLTGLQLAVRLLAQIGDDDSDRAISAVHAACDLAQRVADLGRQALRDTKLNYARPVPAQAVPESVDGLVSVFCYDEVLTFTFCDEAAAGRFAGRFDPSVDSAEAPEHKA